MLECVRLYLYFLITYCGGHVQGGPCGPVPRVDSWPVKRSRTRGLGTAILGRAGCTLYCSALDYCAAGGPRLGRLSERGIRVDDPCLPFVLRYVFTRELHLGRSCVFLVSCVLCNNRCIYAPLYACVAAYIIVFESFVGIAAVLNDRPLLGKFDDHCCGI